jgi:hypothetical protein
LAAGFGKGSRRVIAEFTKISSQIFDADLPETFDDMDDSKPAKSKKHSSKDMSSIKKEKKHKRKARQDSITTESPNTTEKPTKRKRESTNEEPSKKKKHKTKDTVPIPSAPNELEIDVSAPTPPSKKALRAQKKGKSIPPLPSTSQPPASTTGDIHPSRKDLVKDIPRAEFSVWIGNLSYKSDVKGLRGWLVRGDKRITDKEITRIHLPLNADEQSKGYDLDDELILDLRMLIF